MAFIRAASLSDIPPGTAIQVELEGEGYALCNVEGRLYAIDGICPHSAGPIGEGGLHLLWLLGAGAVLGALGWV